MIVIASVSKLKTQSNRIPNGNGEEERQFSIAIGKVAHEKHQLRIGDEISGAGVPVADKRLEPVILQGI